MATSNRTMRKFKIGNHWVHFPFVPYEPQERFMQKMMESMEKAQNALLESPTGTGKTACLICGSLAWLDSVHLKQEETFTSPPERYKIFFCSRTHSQLRQAMQEFQNSSYAHMKVAVLSARRHLCLHPSARADESKLDIKCKTLRRPKTCNYESNLDIEDLCKPCTKCNPTHPHEHQCPYYKNFEDRKRRNDFDVFTQCGALDQGKLKEKCKKYEVCPFYVSRHLEKQADMIFLPYSYVFNPHILRVMQLQLGGSILIVDEGHNIERVCEENASFDMWSSDVAACFKELTSAEEFSDKTDFPEVSLRDVTELKNIIKKLESKLVKEIEAGKSYSGDYLLKQFLDAGLSYANRHKWLGILDSLVKFCADQDCKVDGMKKVHNVISTVFFLDGSGSVEGDTHASALEESFVLYKEKLKKEDKKVEPKIHFWCFDAGVIMKALKNRGVRSFIVTSGTLSPLATLKDSLGISFEVDLINDHVIDRFQVQGLSIRKAPVLKKNMSKNIMEPVEVTLNSRYNHRKMCGDDYYAAVGRVVFEVVSASPKGVLIFFTSSEVKKQCLKRWDEVNSQTNDNSSKTLFDVINVKKEIFLEPSQAGNLNDLQRKFKLKIDNKDGSGACLVGVMSGKVSEGIDFKDDYGRAVIMVGIPFLPIFDQWVTHKKAAVHKKWGANGKKAWELAQAIRPVNQAIGRIIRHRLDYGVVILPDERFAEPGDVRGALPKWLKSNLDSVSFENLKPTLQEFFSSIPVKIEETEVKAEIEKNYICSKHEIEARSEEITADQYFDLIEKKHTEMARKKQLEKQWMDLETEVSEKMEQLEKLKSTVLQEVAQYENNQSMEVMINQNEEAMEEEDSRQNGEASSSKACQDDSMDLFSSESECCCYDTDGGESEWEELDLPGES